jgi:hypothetical protein
MSKTGTKVTLKETRGGTNHLFDLVHALNLLRLQKKNSKKGWVINDENYIFKDNEICKRPSSKPSKKADK